MIIAGIALVVLVLAYKIVGHLVYKHARWTTTVMDDIPELGRPRLAGQKIEGAAVVAGGSLSGLFAARVLSDHFEKVVVIEPDTELEHQRSRVGQWNQAHIFLCTLRLICLRLFSGFDDEVLKAGLLLRISDYNLQMEGKTCQVDSSVFPPVIASCRIGFERLIRRLVLERCSSVTCITGTVIGVSANTDGSRIESVKIRTDDNGDESTIPVALLVDCTGPVCASTKWLPRANPAWTAPKKESYDPQVGYSTGIFQLKPEDLARIDAALPERLRSLPYIRQVYGSTRSKCSLGYGIGRGDENRLFFGMTQWGHIEPYPTSLNEFLAHMKKCDELTSEEGPEAAAPAHEAVRILQDILGEERSAASTFKKFTVTSMHHTRWDLVPSQSLPTNFCVLGDALVRLNPVFGQGCTKAGQDATTLDSVLRTCRGSEVPEDFTRKMLKLQTSRARVFFDSNRIMDYGYSTTVPMEGETLAHGSLLRKYTEAMIRLCHSSPKAGAVFHSSTVMIEPNVVLLKPSFAARVLWNALTASL